MTSGNEATFHLVIEAAGQFSPSRTFHYSLDYDHGELVYRVNLVRCEREDGSADYLSYGRIDTEAGETYWVSPDGPDLSYHDIFVASPLLALPPEAWVKRILQETNSEKQASLFFLAGHHEWNYPKNGTHPRLAREQLVNSAAIHGLRAHSDPWISEYANEIVELVSESE